MIKEKYISVKFKFIKNEKNVSVFDSAMEEIATWDVINGLIGLENWSINEQFEIASVCLEMWMKSE